MLSRRRLDPAGPSSTPGASGAKGNGRNGNGKGNGNSRAPEGIVPPTGGTPFGELLVQQNLIDSADLAAALVRQEAGGSGKRLGTILVEAGALDERSLASALSGCRSPTSARRAPTRAPSAS